MAETKRMYQPSAQTRAATNAPKDRRLPIVLPHGAQNVLWAAHHKDISILSQKPLDSRDRIHYYTDTLNTEIQERADGDL
jgi:hypothetical protein